MSAITDGIIRRSPIGKRFGQWEVTGHEYDEENQRFYIAVECQGCGESTGLKRPYSLFSGRSTRCRNCSRKKIKGRVGINEERRPDPTPDEIAAECEQIQRGWSDAERRRRARQHRVEIPMARVH